MMFLKNIAKKLIKTFNKSKEQYNTVNYSDQIIKSLVVTTYVKKKFNILFMMLITIILRNILCSILCLVFTYNIYVDFFLHSIISIVLILQSHVIYEVIKSKKSYFYKITRYAINNYTIENYRRWKRNILLTLSAIGILMLMFIEINSYLLIYYIIQNLFIYGIVDVIEHDKISKLLKEMKDQPRNKKYEKLTILEDYYILNKTEVNKDLPKVKTNNLKQLKSSRLNTIFDKEKNNKDNSDKENKIDDKQIKELQKSNIDNLFD